ncbi:MAG: TonB-dependent receptor plug domain-containing protein [Prevotella sp.]|nr:TonB-dependent receptor plug domain-containing protein [Prevotella sp.]
MRLPNLAFGHIRPVSLILAVASSLAGVAQTEDVAREDSLREVVVKSRSAQQRMKEVQVGVEKVEIATLAKMPVLFGERDIIKSLQLLPGVKSEGEVSGGYEVRGGTASQNLILLDGATVYNSGHLMGLFSAFNDDALSNASLYKGLVPAQLGGATSSVFDISTRPGDMQDYHASGTIGLLAAKVMVEGPIQEDRSSFIVAGRRSYVDLLLKASDDYKDNTLHFYDLNMSLNFKLNGRNRLTATAFYSRDNMGLEDVMDMKWGNTALSLNWLHTASDRHYANTQLAYSNYDSDVAIDIMNTHYTMVGYISHLTAHHEDHLTLGAHRLNMGVESTLLNLQSAEWDINLLHQRERRKAWTNALWLNDDWHASPGLDMSAGLRLRLFSVLGGAPYYEIDDEGGITNTTNPGSGEFVKTYAHLEPRLSMKLQLGANHTLKLGYSRTTQDIHAIRGNSWSMPFNRYTMTSNILLPEIADQVALGWTGMTNEGDYDFSAETYYKRINNTYDYRDGKSFYSEIEIERLLLGGRGRAYGLELCAHKNSGRLTGWLAYTLSWAENKIPGINGGQWYTAPNDRRHDFNIVGMYRLSDHWDLTATWRYNTGQALSAPSAKYEIDGTTYYYYAERNGYRAPAYHRLDISATHTKRIGRRLTRIWALGLYNAYNRYNPFTISFTNDPDKPTGTKTEQTSIYGIVPSVSFSLKY